MVGQQRLHEAVDLDRIRRPVRQSRRRRFAWGRGRRWRVDGIIAGSSSCSGRWLGRKGCEGIPTAVSVLARHDRLKIFVLVDSAFVVAAVVVIRGARERQRLRPVPRDEGRDEGGLVPIVALEDLGHRAGAADQLLRRVRRVQCDYALPVRRLGGRGGNAGEDGCRGRRFRLRCRRGPGHYHRRWWRRRSGRRCGVARAVGMGCDCVLR